jgi:multidrug efflux system membrane fusion protein
MTFDRSQQSQPSVGKSSVLKPIACGVLALVLLMIALWGWKQHTLPSPPNSLQGTEGESSSRGSKFGKDSKPKPVSAAKVMQHDVSVYLDALGTVTPRNTVTVIPRVSGQLQSVSFHEGQMVKAGELLAQIDPQPFQVALAQAEGQLLKDKALLENALIDLNRYTTLKAQDSIAEQQVATQQSLVSQYRGAVAVDQSQINSAKLQLSYCRIIAPISGRIGLRQVDAGNLLQSTSATGIATITQIQPMTALFSLPEDYLPKVNARHAQPLTVDAFDRAQTDKLASGKLLTTDNQIDVTTGTIKMRATFDNNDGKLFPNQFVNIKLLLEVKKEALLIPASALQRGRKGEYVYVVDDTKTVIQTPVKSGYVDGENVVIEHGLSLGQTVVIDGTDKLKDGAKVKVVEVNAANASQPDEADARARKHHHDGRKLETVAHSGIDPTTRNPSAIKSDAKSDKSSALPDGQGRPPKGWQNKHLSE